MAKTFFHLTGPYKGLLARRLKWTGRLVLHQIINDGAPYWFVQIQNFNSTKDRADGTLIDSNKSGTWRYVDATAANEQFEQLAPFFPPRKYFVPPPATAARLAKLRAMRGKSLARSKQRPDPDIIYQPSPAGKPNTVVDYITEAMEEAQCK